MRSRFDVFEWLRAGVPLSLLADLADLDGPDSRDIYVRELVGFAHTVDGSRVARPGRSRECEL